MATRLEFGESVFGGSSFGSKPEWFIIILTLSI